MSSVNDAEAREFYRHLNEWFVSKTKDSDFVVSDFDPTPIEECTAYFDQTAGRLAAARTEAHDTNMLFFELECIIKNCKKDFYIASVETEAAIKCEEDQYSS